MSSEQNFEAAQRRYFLRGINREVPVPSTPADRQTLAAALGTATPQAPRNAQVLNDAGALMSTFGTSSAAIQADQACRQLPAPSMSMRDPAARAGCGWWFVPDPSLKSRGAYGTRRGPMNPNLDTQIGAGQWIWDPYQAMQMEAAKMASTISSCQDVGYAPAAYNMGWCTSTNMAIATDGMGNPAFPRSAGGDCPSPGTIVTNPANCPVTPPAGGSGGGGGGGISGACSTTPLSPQCVQAIVSQQGCSSNGLLSQNLANGYIDPSQQQYSLVNSYLTSRQFNLDPAFYGANAGSSVDSVSNSVQQLSQIATSAPSSQYNSRTIAAAANMCTGAAFDPCAINPSDSGPFPAACIAGAAQQMGYGSNGGLLPQNIGMSYWNQVGTTWQNILDNLTWWKTSADTPQPSDPPAQVNAISNVYGTTVNFPKQSCNNNGAYMYRYTFPGYNTQYFPPQGPQTHFLGRYLLKNGIPSVGSTEADQTPGGSILTEAQRIIFTWTPTRGGSYQFSIATDDDTKMFIDGSQLIESTCCGVPRLTPILTFVAGQQHTVVFDFWNGGGPWSLNVQYAVSESGDFSDATWQPFPLAEMTMAQDRRLPMIDLSFHKMPQGQNNQSITDKDGILTNLFQWGAGIGQVAGRPALVVNPQTGVWNNHVTWTQGIRIGALKSITMMVCITQPSPPGKQPASLFAMYNVPSTISGGYLSGYPRPAGGPPDSWDYQYRPQCFQIWSNPAGTIGVDYNDKNSSTILPSFQQAPQPAAPVGQWVHYAFAWDPNMSGYSLWVNGNYFGHFETTPINGNQILEQIRLGCDATDDGTTWAGGIQWFRAFDYQIGQEQVTMDMNDAWNTLY
jgi:hypothetical protein